MRISDLTQDPYDEGYDAFWYDGKNHDDNPYQIDTPEHINWGNGWEEAWNIKQKLKITITPAYTEEE